LRAALINPYHPPTPDFFGFFPDTELLGTVQDPAYELEAVKIFEINYITVDFPAL
jgi:hypothetical protein